MSSNIMFKDFAKSFKYFYFSFGAIFNTSDITVLEWSRLIFVSFLYEE